MSDDHTSSTPTPAPSTSRLDAGLEAEIAEALGGRSVDDLMSVPNRAAAPKSGGRQMRTGRVVQVHGQDVFVEFGPKSQGVCPLAHFEDPPALGENFDFVVERLDPFENMLILARPGQVTKAAFGDVEVGQLVEARCTGMNRGGLEMEFAHHKAFMPAAHVDLRHIEDISIFIGQKFPCEIIELKKEKGRMVLSRRKVLERDKAEKREQLMAVLEVGQQRTATIVSVQPYGAFADLGGADGLIPISELAHERLRHAKDAVKEGDVVEVKVIRVEGSGKSIKITLSRKAVMADPVATAMKDLQEGATVTGRVTNLTEFGAFVELAPGVEGLVHISEITHDRLPNPVATLRKDEVVNVKILSIDEKKKRIALSIKALKDAPARPEREHRGGGGGGGGRGGRGREREEPMVERAADPAMQKLLSRFGAGSLKGGLGSVPGDTKSGNKVPK
ncbi:MAG: S1 RNA-binding domain-containing protein [Phycisphaerae bacterium]|nr:S1 RNA-binding domain-containing protein [Phycisphaerae bacterium]